MAASPNSAARMTIFLIVFVDLLGFGIMIPMLPFFARSLGATPAEIGALMFVYSFMQIFLSPVWGSLSDRYGRRPILLLTILGQCAAFLWAGMSMSYMSLLLSRMAAGIFAGNISTASAYMADVTAPSERAKGMGLIGAAIGLGFIFGPAIGGLLIPHGHHWPSLAAWAISFANLILAFFLLKESKASVKERSQNRRRFRMQDFKFVLESPKFFYPMLISFLATFAFVQLEITFGLFVTDRFKFEERDAAFLFAFMGIASALVQGVVLGPLTKRFPEHILIRFGLISALVALGALTAATGMPLLIASLLLLATGYSLMNPCLSALVSKNASSENQGSILGIYQSFGSAARVLAPLGAGLLYGIKLELPFMVGVAILAIGLLVWTLRRPPELSGKAAEDLVSERHS